MAASHKEDDKRTKRQLHCLVQSYGVNSSESFSRPRLLSVARKQEERVVSDDEEDEEVCSSTCARSAGPKIRDIRDDLTAAGIASKGVTIKDDLLDLLLTSKGQARYPALIVMPGPKSVPGSDLVEAEVEVSNKTLFQLRTLFVINIWPVKGLRKKQDYIDRFLMLKVQEMIQGSLRVAGISDNHVCGFSSTSDLTAWITREVSGLEVINGSLTIAPEISILCGAATTGHGTIMVVNTNQTMSSVTSPLNLVCRKVVQVKDTFYGVGQSDGIVSLIKSPSITESLTGSWIGIESALTDGAFDVVGDDNITIAVGRGPETSIVWSPDGQLWLSGGLKLEGGGVKILFLTGQKLWLVGGRNGQMASSTDGQTWNLIDYPPHIGELLDLKADGGLVVALGTKAYGISRDGIEWTTLPLFSGLIPLTLAYRQGLWLMGGVTTDGRSNLFFSINLSTWYPIAGSPFQAVTLIQ